jgi:hypothetical protein
VPLDQRGANVVITLFDGLKMHATLKMSILLESCVWDLILTNCSVTPEKSPG